MKWSRKRGCFPSQARTHGMAVGAVVVDDEVQVEPGRELAVEPAQEGQELLVAVAGVALRR